MQRTAIKACRKRFCATFDRCRGEKAKLPSNEHKLRIVLKLKLCFNV